MSKRLIGHVPVDSGQVMVVDPCYVLKDDDPVAEKLYQEICGVTMSSDKAGSFDLGCATSSGWGDGNYPAYVHYDDSGRVKKLVVDFS
tara:strand:+ start:2076 stop:2339 length:264 start_codon:yes stop_codon:yes gene_type:complete